MPPKTQTDPVPGNENVDKSCHQVGFTLVVDYSPNDAFRVVLAHSAGLQLLDPDR